MGRDSRSAQSETRRLATTEARDSLAKLVNGMRKKTQPSRRLLDDAVEIGPHRKGGAMLVPEVDVRAHVEREERLKQQLKELEDQLEDLLLAQTLEQLYAGRSTAEGKPVEQVARELGFARLLDESR